MTYPDLAQRIEDIHTARLTAASALNDVLGSLPPMTSEAQLARRWQEELAADPQLLPHGWYSPPPEGIGVLAATPPDYARVRQASLRNPHAWPRTEQVPTDDLLLYTYASPVVRDSFMIGDFDITTYRGNNQAVWDHLSACLNLIARVCQYVEVGMELRDIYNHAISLGQDCGFGNDIFSPSDPASYNIGHTVPWSYEDPSDEQLAALRSGDSERIAKTISQARVFLSSQERLKVAPTMALTVEPRFSNGSGLAATFHTIVVFRDSAKEIRTGYRDILDTCAMTPHLPQDALAVLAT